MNPGPRKNDELVAMGRQIARELLGKDISREEALQILRDIMAIPDEDMDILSDYGKTLEAFGGKEKFLQPISKLPHPRERIEAALLSALSKVELEELRNQFLNNLTFLELFVPENEIPFDQNEQAEALIKRIGSENPNIKRYREYAEETKRAKQMSKRSRPEQPRQTGCALLFAVLLIIFSALISVFT